jgi:hypothetical protein
MRRKATACGQTEGACVPYLEFSATTYTCTWNFVTLGMTNFTGLSPKRTALRSGENTSTANTTRPRLRYTECATWLSAPHQSPRAWAHSNPHKGRYQ